MKTIFIVLIIVIACLAPLAVGCSPSPSEKAPTCSPKYYHNKTTEKCEPKYEWVSNTARLWNDARLVDLGTDYVIIRVESNDGIIVTVGLLNFVTKTIERSNYTPSSPKRVEVLLAERGYYDWQPSSNGIIPKNAIEGGQNQNKPVYICRMPSYGQSNLGMVTLGNHTCFSEYFVVSNSAYEVMIYK